MRIAVLDFNKGYPNQGLGNIQATILNYAVKEQVQVHIDVFDVRQSHEVPGLSYDVYICSGGPGSPLDESTTVGERRFFKLIGDLVDHNRRALPPNRKFVFFICHSFQLACKYFKVGTICKRKSTAFGVFPIHKTYAGQSEAVFKGLPDPFYAVDSRQWQVVMKGDLETPAADMAVLAIEKDRPHVPFERAVMAVRFTPEMIGTQFHPETDASELQANLQEHGRRQELTEQLGVLKYNNIMLSLEDPEKVAFTRWAILPAFLDAARFVRIVQRDNMVR